MIIGRREIDLSPIERGSRDAGRKEEGERKGMKKGIKDIIYMYEFHTRNVSMYCKRTNNKKKRNTGSE